jgi:long-chain acyl-CoA synthetase
VESGRSDLSRKPWLAAYGTSIPAEINPDAHVSVLDMLEGAMHRYADKPAFRCFGQTLTYADADRLSRDFAAYLQCSLGVGKGERIAVMLPNLPAFPLALMGIVRTGAIQVNVNPLYTARELQHQLNDAGVEVIVIFSGVSATLAEITARPRSSTSSASAWATAPPPYCRARPWTRASHASSRLLMPSHKGRSLPIRRCN